MRAPTIEQYYADIKKAIKFVGGYTENKKYEFLIKMCRLKPYDYDKKNTCYYKWCDEWGNSLNFLSSKNIKIIFNDLTIDPLTISTDLYEGLDLKKIIKISNIAFYSAGFDQETNQKIRVLSLLGVDDFLRTFVNYDNEWKIYPSLYLGIEALLFIVKRKRTNKHFLFRRQDHIIYPCVKRQAGITNLPASKEFLDMLQQQDNILSELIMERK